MKLKKDSNLALINFSANGDVSEDIIAALIRHGVILEDDESVYGHTITEAQEYKMGYDLICDILDEAGVTADKDNVQAFKQLVLMGDGDCPMCGGWLELDDMKTDVYGDGIHERREHDVKSETYLCPNCGYEHTEYYKR